MNMIFVSGGGDAKQTRKLDAIFVRSISRKKSILYIPIAMNEKEHTYVSCFDWIKSTFKPFNIKKIDMWVDLSNHSYKQLQNYDAIYIGGGNTYKLLYEIRKNKFDILLKKFIKNDGVIYGGSAGAIILGKDIGTAAFGKCCDKNIIGIKKTNGMKLVGNYSLQCHYTIKDDIRIKKYVKKTKSSVIALSEDSGLIIKNKTIHAVGKVYLFDKDGKHIIANNKIFY